MYCFLNYKKLFSNILYDKIINIIFEMKPLKEKFFKNENFTFFVVKIFNFHIYRKFLKPDLVWLILQNVITL